MSTQAVFRGSLLSSEFLLEVVQELPEWAALADETLEHFRMQVQRLIEAFPTGQLPNEVQTETDLIWPILEALGWRDSLRQQNLSMTGREVPDGLLFENENARARALSVSEEWRRYEHGCVTVEAKRWMRPLGHESGRLGEETAPAAQMIRYLFRGQTVTQGRLRWGILTNGAQWRLYYSGAPSVAEQFFEIDLGGISELCNSPPRAEALNPSDSGYWMKVFLLLFGRTAFVASGTEGSTLIDRAIRESKFYEERVSQDLSKKVFEYVFPALVRAIAQADPKLELDQVKEAALVLLYRLLFVLYAEDRDLLPVKDARYRGYSLRQQVRLVVNEQLDWGDGLSDSATRYWNVISDLFRAIGKGDGSIGLPPYNGGLFDPKLTPSLDEIRIPDSTMAPIVDALSYERAKPGVRKYINYRSLSVQQLGSVYERLLEFDVIRGDDGVSIRPNTFARRTSGSYYTPDDLVQLVLHRTIHPLIEQRKQTFVDKVDELRTVHLPDHKKQSLLRGYDPAMAILELRICDPAMGSGHFLVNLVDYLTDHIIEALATAEQLVPNELAGYRSPLNHKISDIRQRIEQNANEHGWFIQEEQIDDRHIIQRMVLKRCVYGVDKNPMAVELAKLSLWLHTFTAGAPLSFLDHHLRCGDSLFGTWVKQGVDTAMEFGSPLLLNEPIGEAYRSAAKMQVIEGLTDAEIAEAHRSADIFIDVTNAIAPLDTLLALIQAFTWLNVRDVERRTAIASFLDGEFGDPIAIATGKQEPVLRNGNSNGAVPSKSRQHNYDCFLEVFDAAMTLIKRERFFNWQVAFPGIWREWDSDNLVGGFDAVVGNPPWDRIKLQEVEWFADRVPGIARMERAADRKQQIQNLVDSRHPLAEEYTAALQRTQTASRVVRQCGDYPLLASGDINLYSLFVERATTIANQRTGMVGLLVPNGIAADKSAADFFQHVTGSGRLRTLFDFVNGRSNYPGAPFFPDISSNMRFCIIVIGAAMGTGSADCASFLQDVSEVQDPNICFPLGTEMFALVNPNTGTAPFFRSKRDADIVTEIYSRLPVLVNYSEDVANCMWPVKYCTMFHMTSDSGIFKAKSELVEQQNAVLTERNLLRTDTSSWAPLYLGGMIHQFDHRASCAVSGEDNLHKKTVYAPTTDVQKADDSFTPSPQFWVPEAEVGGHFPETQLWAIGFRGIASSMNSRTIISAIVPRVGCGNSLPILLPTDQQEYQRSGLLMVANLNSIIFDYVARSKIQGPNINWYIMEQLPVVPLSQYKNTKFGNVDAAHIVNDVALELSYTAKDLVSLATDMGYVRKDGQPRAPFRWKEDRRLQLRAKLDAVFFLLYGIQKREDIAYVFSTFPVWERDEQNRYDGRFLSRDYCLAYVNALLSGNTDVEVRV